MSASKESQLKQIESILSDYQSELNTIDTETNQEKERIWQAIQTEEAEIKSLLERYRTLKRQQELTEVQSSYNRLSDFKQNLLLKIQSTNNHQTDQQSSGEPVAESSQNLMPTTAGSEPKKPLSQINDGSESQVTKLQSQSTALQEAQLTQLLEFIESFTPQELVKLYPADISQAVPNFSLNDKATRSQLLQNYRQHNLDIYQALLKVYQKPDLSQGTIRLPELDQLPTKDRQYQEFLEANYPNALPFFWFLINREPESIKYVVMELAVDHIIQTNTLDDDPNRQDLKLSLSELLAMNNQTSRSDFMRDLFICFHPQRVSQKSGSKNRYFDYISHLIKTQSTLEDSYILQLWNAMNTAGYHAVSTADFVLPQPIQDYQNGHDQSLAPASQHDLL